MTPSRRIAFDPAKPVQTRDGRKAEIICMDFYDDADNRTIIARVALTGQQKKEGSFAFYLDGRVGHYGDPHPCDLINIPEKRWAVIYTIDGEYGVLVTAHEEVLTDAKRTAGAIACIEFTEGDGL